MKEINLTQNKVALVDDEDFERFNQFKWHALFNDYTWYAVRHRPRVNGKRKLIHMHREIMNAPLDMQVDHRNGNGFDNCKENLRLCTRQQNGFNQKHSHKNNKLGIKGVCWHKGAKKFHARIGINGRNIHLGLFNVLADADHAYRVAEEKYFGEFARQIGSIPAIIPE